MNPTLHEMADSIHALELQEARSFVRLLPPKKRQKMTLNLHAKIMRAEKKAEKFRHPLKKLRIEKTIEKMRAALDEIELIDVKNLQPFESIAEMRDEFRYLLAMNLAIYSMKHVTESAPHGSRKFMNDIGIQYLNSEEARNTAYEEIEELEEVLKVKARAHVQDILAQAQLMIRERF